MMWIRIEVIEAWEYWIQSAAILSLVILLQAGRVRNTLVRPIILGTAAFVAAISAYLGVYHANWVATIIGALLSACGFYLAGKTRNPAGKTPLFFPIWLCILAIIIVISGAFSNVFFDERIYINSPFRLYMSGALLWGGFALLSSCYILWKWRNRKQSFRVGLSSSAVCIISAFWLLFIGVKMLDHKPFIQASAFDGLAKGVYWSTAVTATDKWGATRLINAAGEGDMEEVKEQIAKGAEINSQGGNLFAKKTPLTRAMNEHYEIFIYLISQGADVNLIDEDGLAPIHFVKIKDGDTRYADALLEAGADIFIQARKDRTQAIHHAAQSRFNFKKGESPSFSAQLEKLAWLVQHGADIEADASWGAPLHYAASSGSPEAVKWLVEHGANPLSQNIKGETPLQLARNALEILYKVNLESSRLQIERLKEVVEYLAALDERSAGNQ